MGGRWSFMCDLCGLGGNSRSALRIRSLTSLSSVNSASVFFTNVVMASQSAGLSISSRYLPIRSFSSRSFLSCRRWSLRHKYSKIPLASPGGLALSASTILDFIPSQPRKSSTSNSLRRPNSRGSVIRSVFRQSRTFSLEQLARLADISTT